MNIIAQIEHIDSSLLLKTIGDMVFVLNREGVHLEFYAPSDKELLLSPSQFLGKSVKEMLPEDAADLYMENLSRTLETGEIQTFEYELQFCANDFRYFEARMCQKSADTVLVLARNISGRYKSEIFFHTVFHTNPVPMIVADMDTLACIDVNVAYSTLLGSAQEDLLGVSCLEDSLVDDDPASARILDAIRRGENINRHEIKLRNNNGRLLEVRVTASYPKIGSRLIAMPVPRRRQSDFS